MSAWTFLVLTMGVVIAPFLPISHATAKDGWTSQRFQDHPLVGTIWNSDSEAVTISELEKALANARFVLLGEIHDNPDHHRLQAQLIDGLVRKGRRPAIVFEMIPANLQPELDRHVNWLNIKNGRPRSGSHKKIGRDPRFRRYRPGKSLREKKARDNFPKDRSNRLSAA